MEITTSFDNITITAHVKESKIKKLKYIIENEVAIYVKRSSFDRFEAFTKSGNSEILHISYDKIKGQAFQARPFRLEFNPNKLRDKDISIYKDIINYITSPWIMYVFYQTIHRCYNLIISGQFF